MKDIPKDINSITGYGSFFRNNVRSICYTIDENEETEQRYYVKIPGYNRPKKSEEIIEQNKDFVNGFKVVKTLNGEFAYLREHDNVLLPYRYDIAFDFNEFGFAIVGKEGQVSWIDKDFKYLDRCGKMKTEELNDISSKLKGWHKVSSFSKGDIPLSRVYDGSNIYNRVAYFDTDGEIKKFYSFDGTIDEQDYIEIFSNGQTFDEKGFAWADKYLVFAKGYYISYDSLVKLSTEKGFIDSICKDAEKCFAEKELKRVRK